MAGVPVANMPAADVDIDEGLVRRLLADQHPDLAGLPLRPLASGWDNVLFRLGDELTVRLPRRTVAAELVENEQRWLPELASQLPVAVPAPVRVGRAALGYPWSWSVCPWLSGEVAATAPFDADEVALALGRFLGALHRPAPPEAPTNEFRGVPLAARDERTRATVDAVGSLVDGAAALALWERCVTAPVWSGPPMWVHGDLHPLNVLVHQRRLAAVIDFGDINGGDPATDLAIGWTLFDPPARHVFRAAAAYVDDDTWLRARGWALALGLAYLAGSADNPPLHAIGLRAVTAALADH